MQTLEVTPINNSLSVTNILNTVVIDKVKININNYFLQASYSASFVEEDDNG